MKKARYLFQAVGIIVFAALSVYIIRPYVSNSTSSAINVLLITLDTTRADRLGCYGYPYDTSPAIDKVASEGALFLNAWSCAPLTLPAHASIMTGLYPPEHGLRVNGPGKMSEDITTLAEVFSQEGFATFASVAANVLSTRHGLNQGFDTYLIDDTPLRERANDELYTAASHISQSYISWMNRRLMDGTTKPFFTWLHYYDPHTPRKKHIGTKEFIGADTYDHEVRFMDFHIGSVLEYLDQTGFTSNTLVLLVGDHGEGLGDHGESTHGHMLYNTTQHVPLIARLPGVLPEGVRYEYPVTLVDIFPSLISLMKNLGSLKTDIDSNEAHINIFTNATNPNRVIYAETFQPYLNYLWCPLQSIIYQGHKFIHTAKPELYNIDKDPNEKTNIVHDHEAIVHNSHIQLLNYLDDMTVYDASSLTLTDDELAKLQSLGYISGGGDAELPAISDRMTNVQDVKHLIDIAVEVDAAMKYDQSGEQVIDLCNRLIEDAPDTPVFHYWKGLILANAKRYDESLPSLTKAIEQLNDALATLPPNENTVKYLTSAHEKAGLVQSFEKRFHKAIAHFEAALELDPDRVSCLHYMGLAYAELDDYITAKSYLERAAVLNPDNEEVSSNLQIVLNKLSKENSQAGD